MEAINLFESHLKTLNYSPHTVRAYVQDVKEWEETKLNPREYLNSIDIKPISKQRKLSSIKKFSNFTNRNGEKEVFNHKIAVRGKILPQSINKDINQILNKIKMVSVRDYLICAVLYETGMRLSELLSLSNKSFVDCSIKVKGKGNKERIVYISPDLCLDISSYPNQFLNLSESAVRNIVNKWFGVSPHKLRHTFASHLVQNGASIKVVQGLLGHSTVKTTCIYANFETKSLISEHRKAFK